MDNYQFEQINNILAEWDPIGVGSDLAMSEYKGYVPEISAATNKTSIIAALEKTVNQMGLGYDPNNQVHKESMENVASRILQLKEPNN